jgi:hypothetical protein
MANAIFSQGDDALTTVHRPPCGILASQTRGIVLVFQSSL